MLALPSHRGIIEVMETRHDGPQPKEILPSGTEVYFLHDQMELSDAEREAIQTLIPRAKEAMANPTESGYHVKAAIIDSSGIVGVGGNREYVGSRAWQHGETAALGALLGKLQELEEVKADYAEGTPLNADIEGVFFYGDTHEVDRLCPSMCGNCRDTFLEEANPNMLIAGGNEDMVMATRLSDLMFEDFEVQEVIDRTMLEQFVGHDELEAVLAARRRSNHKYLKEHNAHMNYGVGLISDKGVLYPGGMFTTAGFDAVSPGVVAINSMTNRPSDSRDMDLSLESIVIVGQAAEGDGVPSPLYRDRNALLEIEQTLDPYRDRPKVPVFIIGVDNNEQPTHLAITDTDEMLPYPFTDRSLGTPEDVMLEDFERIERNL